MSSNGSISPRSLPTDTVLAQVPSAMESSRDNFDRFSSCSMDSCFDYSRCENMDELLVYHYGTEYSPAWQFKDALERSPYYTTDPEKACLFLVTVDRRVDSGSLKSLPFWNNGLNHVVISTEDKSRSPNLEATEMASTLTTITHQSVYRTGFDLSVPLPQKWFYPEIQKLKALERKYFLTFKGARFSQEFAPGGGIRNSPILSGMHNGEDIIIATTCQQVSSSEMYLRGSELRAECARDQSIYNNFKYKDLMDSTFGLVPAGRAPSSDRLLEVLSAGSIPVIISDNYVLPFDTLIEWRRCALVFPSSQMHRIVPTLRTLDTEEVESRRDYCLFVYREFLENDDKIVASTAMALKSRFFGVLPKLIPNVPLPSPQLSSEQEPTLYDL